MIFFTAQRLVHVSWSIVSRVSVVRNFCAITISQKSKNTLVLTRCSEFYSVLGIPVSVENIVKRNIGKKTQDKIPAVQMKKRLSRKKRLISDEEEVPQPGFWNVKAMATAEEYNLECLMEGLLKQDLYAPNKINTSAKCE